MQINNIEIPDEGVTKEYIADPIGGIMYVVYTNVSVQQLSLIDFQAKADSARQEVVTSQALADELETQATDFAQAVQLVQATPSEQVVSE